MIDAVITNPRDILYPWFYRMMSWNRFRFGKVIIVMTQKATDLDFTEYIRKSIPEITLIEKFPDDGKDWRNAAITEALTHSDGDRVLFMEQDFLFEQDFLENTLSQNANTIGFYEGTRLHPAFLLVRKSVLQNTRQDFSIDPDKGDHFSKITTDLEKIGGIVELKQPEDLPWGERKWTGFHHLSGLTQNMRLVSNWHHPQTFFQYNKLSQELPQHTLWREICKKKEVEMGLFSPHPLVDLKSYFYDQKVL